HLLLFVLIEGGAGDSDDHHDHAEMDDVASVAASVAVRELDHGGEHTLSAFLGNDASAAIELTGDGQRTHDRKADGHQGIKIRDVLPGAEAEGASPTGRSGHQENCSNDGADGGPQKVALQAFKRGLAPCEQRTQGSENNQEQPNRNGYAVVERG